MFLKKMGVFKINSFKGFTSNHFRKYKNGAGFTLLELLVVVSIIAFLASISLIALGIAQSKARDSRRQVDAFTIIKAAELWRNDNGFGTSIDRYPKYWKGLGQNESNVKFANSNWLDSLIHKAEARIQVQQLQGGRGVGGSCMAGVCVNTTCQFYNACTNLPPAGASGSCQSSVDCQPAVDHSDYFISDTDEGWLKDLEPYLSGFPQDPGGHDFAEYDTYYISSHPEIVNNHGLCIFISFEREDNTIPEQFSDITLDDMPIQGDPNWSVLCAE